MWRKILLGAGSGFGIACLDSGESGTSFGSKNGMKIIPIDEIKQWFSAGIFDRDCGLLAQSALLCDMNILCIFGSST